MNAVVKKVEVSRRALWFGLLGGAVAWTFHLVLAYAIAEFGCVGRLGEMSHLGISMVAWFELALTAATALLAGAATFVAYRNHRCLASSAQVAGACGAAELHTAWAGLLTSGIFTFIILFESIPIFYYLRNC